MIRVEKFNSDTLVITIQGFNDLLAFEQLVQRGAATWADAPPRIKEAADLITTGHKMQDYDSQTVDLRTSKYRAPVGARVYEPRVAEKDRSCKYCGLSLMLHTGVGSMCPDQTNRVPTPPLVGTNPEA